MKNKKRYVQEILNFLYSERESIEYNGHHDPDLRKTYRYINMEIQKLQRTLFKNEYHDLRTRLAELFDTTCPFEKKESEDAIP